MGEQVHLRGSMPVAPAVPREDAQLSHLPVEAIPKVLGDLERIKAVLWGRLLAGQALPVPRVATVAPDADRLLTAKQAAEVAGVSPKWLYRHARSLPFARRLSPRVVRFSEAGLRKWLPTRKA